METPVAFVTAHEGSRLELLVNFGILTGREATQAEIDRLARTLTPTPDRLAIAAERRHEYAEGTETVVNIVSVETDAAPDDDSEAPGALRGVGGRVCGRPASGDARPIGRQ